MKNYFIPIFLMITIILAACGSENTANESNAESNEGLQIASGGTSGTYFPIAVAMANAMTDDTKFTVESQTTGGSIANLRLLNDGEVKLLFSGAITADAAYQGEEPFEGPIEDVRSIAALYPETVQIITRKDSGIQSIADLEGKTVAVGAPGSGTERVAGILLELLDLSYDDIRPEFLGFSEAVTSMQDENIDAAFIMAGVPTSAVIEAGSSMDLDIINFEEDAVEEIIEQEPYLISETIAADTYEGIDNEILSLATPATLLVSEDLSEDEVYELTKSVFDNIESIHESHFQAQNISVERALEGLSIPLHPGAAKYYEEQGLDVE